jgi:hypothetical protein
MTGAVMAAIKRGRIGDIKMTHEFGQVSVRCGQKQMKMIGDADIGK